MRSIESNFGASQIGTGFGDSLWNDEVQRGSRLDLNGKAPTIDKKRETVRKPPAGFVSGPVEDV